MDNIYILRDVLLKLLALASIPYTLFLFGITIHKVILTLNGKREPKGIGLFGEDLDD